MSASGNKRAGYYCEGRGKGVDGSVRVAIEGVHQWLGHDERQMT